MRIYSTCYEKYSDSQLTALFSSESWKSLSFSQRINACQEVENRYAAENNVQPCTITYQPMNGACYGWQNGNTICLNSYLLQDGQFCTNYTDANGNKQSIRTDVLAPGWNTLDTVYHEGKHGIQEQTGKMPSTYISPEMDGNLYRIQGIEKEAYANGQMRTMEALSNYEKETGHLDAERNDYIASVKNDSFQAALVDASHNYNDPNIEQTLQTVINDRENNIIRTNASESYNAISNLCDSYGIRSSVDVSSAMDNPPTGMNSNISSALENAGADNRLDDGLSDTNDIKEGNDLTSVLSLEDGHEEFSAVSQLPLEYTDDGMNDFISNSISLSTDDGFSNAEPITDYSGSEQLYADDGLEDISGFDTDSSSGEDISISSEIDYAE